MAGAGREPMLDIYIIECTQLLENLEDILIKCEKEDSFGLNDINEIFRAMHTIKGSSAMMLFNDISKAAHSIEDLFFFLREDKPTEVDNSILTDIVLEGIDFIKAEIDKVDSGITPDGNSDVLTEKNKEFLLVLKQLNGASTETKVDEVIPNQKFYISNSEVLTTKKTSSKFKAVVRFEADCGMENIRSFTVVNRMQDHISSDYAHFPDNLLDETTATEIQKNGFVFLFGSDKSFDEVKGLLNEGLFIKDVELKELTNQEEFDREKRRNQITLEVTLDEPSNIAPLVPKVMREDKKADEKKEEGNKKSAHSSMINVSIEKLDNLMDLISELVISESMVSGHPELKGLDLVDFYNETTHLHKIAGELQDIVMSIRMVPLGPTFNKMNRIVRDMCKQLEKEVTLELIGEDTEVDKNIIDHISDPLMHIIRNSVDHGIEAPFERESVGKDRKGTVTLEAKNTGSEILIIIRDDGKGLNREKILKKARDNGLISKPDEELTDREIFQCIFLPGFSTKEQVTGYSGRGVGMDVVSKNIEAIGGKVLIDSVEGEGSVFTLKLPLTLAIIKGMNIRIGNSKYTFPINAIKESIIVSKKEVVIDPYKREMLMVRGECYPLYRLNKLLNSDEGENDIEKGVVIRIDSEEKAYLVFVDEVLGEQDIVIKSMPKYLGKTRGISGCTLLGDGSVSLIIDVNELKERG